MKVIEKTKRALYECRFQLLFILGISVTILLFQLFKTNRQVMNFIADYITSPIKRCGAAICDIVPFSVSEWVIYGLIAAVIIFIVLLIKAIKRSRGNRVLTACKRLLCFGCAVLLFYDGFVYLWGVNYYTDSFQDKSGIYAQAVEQEQLIKVTELFAKGLNAAAEGVVRAENGVYSEPTKEIIAQSKGVFKNIYDEFPFLQGDDVTPKPFVFSELLSLLETTGFFFPWLGESNFNSHSPKAAYPATIAHELAHQRGIASEQEANFVAILACIESEHAAYRYSGYMLGYVYLNNALYSANYSEWERIFSSLSASVRADMTFANEYWAKYETPISQVADAVSDSRLKNYGQELGIKSYGAVTDLLVAYFK